MSHETSDVYSLQENGLQSELDKVAEVNVEPTIGEQSQKNQP